MSIDIWQLVFFGRTSNVNGSCILYIERDQMFYSYIYIYKNVTMQLSVVIVEI